MYSDDLNDYALYVLVQSSGTSHCATGASLRNDGIIQRVQFMRRRRRQSLRHDVGIPQSGQHFRRNDLAGVARNESHEEHAVLTQIIVRKSLATRVRLTVQLVQAVQLFTHVLRVTAPVERLEEPLQHAEGGHYRNEDDPEPDEDEDFLVEEVDGKNTLHCVAMDVAQLTHLQINGNLCETAS